jgi:hypothetical protein
LKTSAQADISKTPCTTQPCTAVIVQPHQELLKRQAKLQEMRYAWGQMSLPSRSTVASPTPSKTLEQLWFTGCRWWRLHAPKP